MSMVAMIPIVFAPGTAYRVDELCPQCFLPSLWGGEVYALYTINDTPRIVHASTVRVCHDCDYRTHKKKGPS